MTLDLPIPDCETARKAAAESLRLKQTKYLAVDRVGKAIGVPTTCKLVAAREGTERNGVGFDTYQKGKRVNFTGTEGCNLIIEKGHPISS